MPTDCSSPTSFRTGLSHAGHSGLMAVIAGVPYLELAGAVIVGIVAVAWCVLWLCVLRRVVNGSATWRAVRFRGGCSESAGAQASIRLAPRRLSLFWSASGASGPLNCQDTIGLLVSDTWELNGRHESPSRKDAWRSPDSLRTAG